METDDAELRVYVKAGCAQCERARALAAEAGAAHPGLTVEIVDVSEGHQRRDEVFATPTFVLDGRVLSLGNPRREKLWRAIEASLDRAMVD
jgi:glutaredoxin